MNVIEKLSKPIEQINITRILLKITIRASFITYVGNTAGVQFPYIKLQLPFIRLH